MPTIAAHILFGSTISALLAAAALPAAAVPRTCAIPVTVNHLTPSSTLSSYEIYTLQTINEVAGTNLFFTTESLFRVNGDEAARLTTHLDESEILSTHLVGSTILVNKQLGGLFRLDGNELWPLSTITDLGRIWSTLPVGGNILVGADQGLFRLADDELTPLDPGTYTGRVTAIQSVDGVILVGTDQGLFRFADGALTRPDPGTDTGWITAIHPVGGTILVGADQGLFRFADGALTRLDPGTDMGWITATHPVDGAILVGAEKGLFRFADGALKRLDPGTDTGWITAIHPGGGTILVGAEKGLFRFADGALKRLDPGADTGSITAIHPGGGTILVGAEKGLFRLKGDDLQEVKSDKPLAPNPHIWPIDDQLWIAVRNELFRYVTDTGRVSSPKEPLAFGTATTASLRFTLPPCLGLLRPSEFGLIPEASTPFVAATSPTPIMAEFVIVGTPTRRALSASVGPLQAGTWRVQLAVKAGDGWDPVSDPVELRVAWTPVDYATHFIGQAIPWLGAVHTGLFVLLLAGARRSAWCGRVVSDKLWGRVGLWWHAALRHAPPLQRWVLARWFDASRRRGTRPYLPVPLAAPDGAVITADALLDRLRTQPRLWIQGGAGMGKTTLVDELSRQFFADHASLRAAYRRYGLVPIVVRIRDGRDVQDIKADPAQPDRWVPELARLALRARGLRIDDPTLFRAILESGYFALILDGANETANVAALEEYARTTPEVRILVTSQADPAKPGFEILRLPAAVEQSVGPLLALFLGPERGTAVLEAVRPTPLWLELTSGYDVRLLADLAGHDGPVPELPAGRIGLYRALLGRLRHAGGPYPEAELSRAAWAMWRDGVRQFDGTKYLAPDLIKPLRHEDARVVRTIDGTLHEFRHDQMRGYLAAVGAAQYEVAPIRLFETDKAIWRLYFHEQAPVWEFFAALVDQARGEAIWQWCLDDPERAVLLHALDQRGRRDGWTLVRNAPEQGVPTVAR